MYWLTRVGVLSKKTCWNGDILPICVYINKHIAYTYIYIYWITGLNIYIFIYITIYLYTQFSEGDIDLLIVFIKSFASAAIPFRLERICIHIHLYIYSIYSGLRGYELKPITEYIYIYAVKPITEGLLQNGKTLIDPININRVREIQCNVFMKYFFILY